MKIRPCAFRIHRAWDPPFTCERQQPEGDTYPPWNFLAPKKFMAWSRWISFLGPFQGAKLLFASGRGPDSDYSKPRSYFCMDRTWLPGSCRNSWKKNATFYKSVNCCLKVPNKNQPCNCTSDKSNTMYIHMCVLIYIYIPVFILWHFLCDVLVSWKGQVSRKKSNIQMKKNDQWKFQHFKIQNCIIHVNASFPRPVVKKLDHGSLGLIYWIELFMPQSHLPHSHPTKKTKYWCVTWWTKH